MYIYLFYIQISYKYIFIYDNIHIAHHLYFYIITFPNLLFANGEKLKKTRICHKWMRM